MFLICLQSRDHYGHGRFCGFNTFAAHLPCGRCIQVFFTTKKTKIMTLKDELTSLCTGIILSQVRVKGRETYISDESGINRKYLNRRNFRLLRFHRLIRLLYSTANWTSRSEFVEIGKEMFEAIWDKNDENEGELEYKQ